MRGRVYKPPLPSKTLLLTPQSLLIDPKMPQKADHVCLLSAFQNVETVFLTNHDCQICNSRLRLQNPYFSHLTHSGLTKNLD
jgi:hypothetical protein